MIAGPVAEVGLVHAPGRVRGPCGATYQPAQLRIDEESGFQIVFDEHYPVDVEFDEDEDRVYVSALVLAAAQATTAVQTRALTGNGFGLMTAGAAFSLDPVARDLLLTRAFPLAATTADEFAIALAA